MAEKLGFRKTGAGKTLGAVPNTQIQQPAQPAETEEQRRRRLAQQQGQGQGQGQGR